jgi:GT2 family glycosyltransferase
MTRTAVVTLVHGRHQHLRLQHDALSKSTLTPDHYVIVAIDDPYPAQWRPRPMRPHVVELDSAGSSLPLAAARNLGARTALEMGADVVIFLDVDCVPSPGLVAGYVAAAYRADTRNDLLCGPVAYLPPPPPDGYQLDSIATLAAPHPVRPAPSPETVVRSAGDHHLFWSSSFALRQELWKALGGFDEAYVGYGAEDTDFGQRALRAGVTLAWVGSARAYHQHHPVNDPPVEHLDDTVRNANLFHDRWGFWPMQGWLDEFVARGLIEPYADAGTARLVRIQQR